jgi:hypothetical protein
MFCFRKLNKKQKDKLKTLIEWEDKFKITEDNLKKAIAFCIENNYRIDSHIIPTIQDYLPFDLDEAEKCVDNYNWYKKEIEENIVEAKRILNSKNLTNNDLLFVDHDLERIFSIYFDAKYFFQSLIKGPIENSKEIKEKIRMQEMERENSYKIFIGEKREIIVEEKTMKTKDGLDYCISFDTNEMPGKIVCVRVQLDTTIIGMDDKIRLDLVNHPLYRHLEEYVLNNRITKENG